MRRCHPAGRARAARGAGRRACAGVPGVRDSGGFSAHGARELRDRRRHRHRRHGGRRAGARAPDRHRHARDLALRRAERVLRRPRGAPDAQPGARPARSCSSPGRERHDRYGRLLAYVQVVGGPDDLEATLLERGAARTLAIAPNTDRAAALRGDRARGPAGRTRPVGRLRERAERRNASTPTGGRPATEGPPAPGRVWQPGAANSAAPAPPPPCGRPCSVPAATIPIDDALEKGRDRGGCDRCDGLGSGSADAPEARARRAAHGPAERPRRAHGDAHLRRARGLRPGPHAHAPLRRVGGRGRARPDRAHRRPRRAPQRRSGVRGGRRRPRGNRPPRRVRLARQPRSRAWPRPVRAGLGRRRPRRLRAARRRGGRADGERPPDLRSRAPPPRG